ncbi:hypothetical protein TWF506_007934 [Arthrobotrys conoides]|uniref:C2H2-type domain-containing protein n=1 Tax=Arthrobotrys conoides TaxID=74498 RepID=A0AAN8RUU0_9PEZI
MTCCQNAFFGVVPYCRHGPHEAFGSHRRPCRRNLANNHRRHGHICHVCGNTFYTALEVDEHFKIVHGYSCGLCQKKCRSSGGLKLHQRIHRPRAASLLEERDDGHGHGNNYEDDDEEIRYLPEINRPSSRSCQSPHQEREDEACHGFVRNEPNLSSQRVCHNCSRQFGKTSAYLHHLENSRCGPGGNKIYKIVRRLDQENLITCPPSLKYTPPILYQCPLIDNI